MRYGGDEFLIISRYDLIPKIKAGLRAIKKRSMQPYDLHLSMGSICVSKNDGYTLDEAVKRPMRPCTRSSGATRANKASPRNVGWRRQVFGAAPYQVMRRSLFVDSLRDF